MPPPKRPPSVLDGEASDQAREADRVTGADDALAAAEEADAEAAEAEAVAAAARARARAIRLRREAAAAAEAARASAEAAGSGAAEEAGPAEEAETGETETDSAASEVEQPGPSTTEAAGSEVDDEDVDEDLEDLAEPPAPAAWKVIAKAAVVAVAVAGSLALLGLSAAMYVHHRNVAAQQAQTAEFAAAARQGVVTLMSLDFNKAKDDVQRIIDNTTGEFKKDFQGQADEFIKVAQASKVVTEANVNAVAVQSMGKDDATVLIAVTTNVSNAASKQQPPRSWRLRVGVARDGDQIKLAKVEFVP